MKILLIGLGGFLGAICRYGLYGLNTRLAPFGTLTANLVGCFLIGLLYALFKKHGLIDGPWRDFAFAGFLGGFTTFSAFGLESFQLASSRPLAMALYVGGSVVAGILAVWAGHVLGSR